MENKSKYVALAVLVLGFASLQGKCETILQSNSAGGELKRFSSGSTVSDIWLDDICGQTVIPLIWFGEKNTNTMKKEVVSKFWNVEIIEGRTVISAIRTGKKLSFTLSHKGISVPYAISEAFPIELWDIEEVELKKL